MRTVDAFLLIKALIAQVVLTGCQLALQLSQLITALPTTAAGPHLFFFFFAAFADT